MPWFTNRPNREADAIAAYWDALVDQHPAVPVPPAGLPPDQGAVIRQLHAEEALGSLPAYQDELLQRLLATYEEEPSMTSLTTAASLPQSQVSPPYRPGFRDSAPVSRRRSATPRPRTGWPLRPAFQIALVILLVLASVGGIWIMNTGQDEPHRLLAPEVATPSAEASPGWTHFKGDAARSGKTNAGPVSEPVEIWRYQAGDACNPSPAAVGDTVYVACSDGMLTAFDATTGSIRWQFSAEPFVDGPSVADGVAYVIGGSGVLYAVDTATGTELWRVQGHLFNHSPAADGDTLVASTAFGAMIGIDTATGTQRWRTQVVDAGPVRSPALADGIAYAGSESGGLVAVDMATGDILWRGDTGTGGTGTASVADGIVYISSGPNAFGFDAKTGDLLWQREEWGGAPTTSGDIGFSAKPEGFFAFDLATGDELWRASVGWEIRPWAVSSEIAYVPSDADRAIYAFDRQTGAPLWSIAVDGGMWGGPAVADGRIYVATTFGVVQVFGEGGAGAVAASPAATPVTTPEGSLVTTPSASPDATSIAVQDIAVELAWQTTGGPDPLLVPTGMAVAPDGTIWVVDSGNNRFQLFSPDGEYLETWGAPGEGEGQFNFVRSPGDIGNSWGSIAFAPDGSFYVAESANHRVQHFSADRTLVGAWGSFGTGDGQFSDPIGVAVAPDGNVYVIDDQGDDIQVFDPEGTYLFSFGGHGTGLGQLNYTGSLAIAPDGTVYVADFGNYRIQQFAADGTVIMAFGGQGNEEGQFTGPANIAIGPDGTLYVTEPEGGRVQAFTPEGEFLGAWSPASNPGGAPFVPIGITVDTDGSVYVADVVGGTVQKLEVTLPVMPDATPVN